MNNESTLNEQIFEFLMSKTKEVFDLTSDLFFDPYKYVGTSYSGHYKRHFSKQICDLKRSPYFKVKDNKFYVTPIGRIKIIKEILKNKNISNDKKWDGLWLIVVFDMPEITRRARDLLRRELKWMKFVEAQKSVWVTPYGLEEELSVLMKLWLKDLGGKIRIIRANKITEDKDLREHFNL